MRKLPNFRYEEALWKKGYIVIGVDEVGRGALAGPLYVGAVCFDFYKDRYRIEKLGINDSKKLSPKKREKLSDVIKSVALTYATASVSHSIVNKKGIVAATKIAQRKVIKNIRAKLNGRKVFVLIDAFYLNYLKGIGLKKQKAIIKGDEKSISIAAASIIAKVERDHNMIKLHHKYPIYFWKNNKGYGTIRHIAAIKKYGKSKLHRDLFLRKIL